MTHFRHSRGGENDPYVTFAGITKRVPLTTLKEKLIRSGAKVLSYGRYVAIQMAEVAIPPDLFADILRMIAEPRPPPLASTA